VANIDLVEPLMTSWCLFASRAAAVDGDHLRTRPSSGQATSGFLLSPMLMACHSGPAL